MLPIPDLRREDLNHDIEFFKLPVYKPTSHDLADISSKNQITMFDSIPAKPKQIIVVTRESGPKESISNHNSEIPQRETSIDVKRSIGSKRISIKSSNVAKFLVPSHVVYPKKITSRKSVQGASTSRKDTSQVSQHEASRSRSKASKGFKINHHTKMALLPPTPYQANKAISQTALPPKERASSRGNYGYLQPSFTDTKSRFQLSRNPNEVRQVEIYEWTSAYS